MTEGTRRVVVKIGKEGKDTFLLQVCLGNPMRGCVAAAALLPGADLDGRRVWKPKFIEVQRRVEKGDPVRPGYRRVEGSRFFSKDPTVKVDYRHAVLEPWVALSLPEQQVACLTDELVKPALPRRGRIWFRHRVSGQ